MSATFQWVENLHITHHDTTQDFQFCIGITLKGLNFLEFPFCFFVCCCFTYLSWISSMSCRASWSLFTSLTYRDRSWGKQTDWVSLFRKHHHIYTLIMPLKGRFLSLIQFTLRRGSMHARFLAPFLQTLPELDYATEGALHVSAHLSTKSPLKDSWSQHPSQNFRNV